MAGQMYTKGVCVNCKEYFMHHNTAIPLYCIKCRRILPNCEMCGEKI